MNKMIKSLLFNVILGLSLMFISSSLWAGMVSKTKAHCSTCAAKANEAQTQVKTETLIGELVSSSGTHQKAEGTKLSGPALSYDYTFRTPDGKLWAVAKTKQSEKLLSSEYVGKTIEIVGKKDETTQAIEVKSFKIVQAQPQKQTPKSAGNEKAMYTCPMHPEVTSNKPGDCPKCGMHLVKKQ